MNITIIVNGKVARAVLCDSKVSRSFAAQFPMTVEQHLN